MGKALRRSAREFRFSCSQISTQSHNNLIVSQELEIKMKRRPPIDEENGFAEHGGYMSAKISKLEEQFTTIQAACKSKSKIFEGISIFVNGFTNPSAEELKRIMLEHSGERFNCQINLHSNNSRFI